MVKTINLKKTTKSELIELVRKLKRKKMISTSFRKMANRWLYSFREKSMSAIVNRTG